MRFPFPWFQICQRLWQMVASLVWQRQRLSALHCPFALCAQEIFPHRICFGSGKNSFAVSIKPSSPWITFFFFAGLYVAHFASCSSIRMQGEQHMPSALCTQFFVLQENSLVTPQDGTNSTCCLPDSLPWHGRRYPPGCFQESMPCPRD